MIVIADTSPISYLIRIGEIEILPQLYRCITIPEAVSDELKSPSAPPEVRNWIARPPAWLEVRNPVGSPDADLVKVELDAGECDAILLAWD